LFLGIGLVGAVMTAAYMYRCVHLTFFGEYRGSFEHELVEVHEAEALHAGDELVEVHLAEEQDHLDHAGAHGHSPHESNGTILWPLYILSFFAVTAGLLNNGIWNKFEEWSFARYPDDFKEIVHAPAFNIIVALGSVAIALIGAGVAWAYYTGRLHALENLSERNSLAHAGKTFLARKLYLDDLYENVIVAGIKGPIARGSYWIDRHIIDNVLNNTGRTAMRLGRETYQYIDQKGVDGLVNGIGTVTGETGGAVRRAQTGRLQFYALMLVAGVVLFAALLWIFT